MIKMNMKKIGILSLLAVVVVIIAVALIIGRVDPGAKTGPGGITVPSGFIGLNVEGDIFAEYVGSGTAEDALSAFRAAAINADWRPVEENGEIPADGIPAFEFAGVKSFMAIFEKGDNTLIIQVGQVKDQVMVDVWLEPKDIEGVPMEEVMPEEIGPPTSDVEGKDIPDAPRYPGSVRTSYSSLGGTMLASYITSASVNEILRFYKKELPANGWIDIIDTQMESSFVLDGRKEGASMSVASGPDEYYPDYASIMIWRFQE